MDYKKDIGQGSAFAPEALLSAERKMFYQTLSQRTEKVATAIYMVTSHIDDREAIKASFRDAALALVLETISLEDFLHPVEEIFQSLTLAITKLHSLLNLASALRMVSLSNAHILQSELGSIREQCAAGQKYYALATLDDVLKTIYPEEALPADQSNGQTIKTLEESSQKNKPESQQEIVQDKKETKPTVIAPIKKETAAVVTGSAVGSNRKDAILQLIRDKGEVSIKDISQNFYECSEKTIQRDINALVEEGRLQKDGDRRWSRYSIRK